MAFSESGRRVPRATHSPPLAVQTRPASTALTQRRARRFNSLLQPRRFPSIPCTPRASPPSDALLAHAQSRRVSWSVPDAGGGRMMQRKNADYTRDKDSPILQSMSALPPKADIAEHRCDVRFVPKADIALLQSITSSARCCRSKGTSNPSPFAVLRLIDITNFVGNCTANSAGLVPLSMRST